MGDVYNPATGRITKQVPFCDATAVGAAVKAAAAALPEWRPPRWRRAGSRQQLAVRAA
jgi:acyl-CoA reductase-like NAD-dependent aldehyde dehydrogenase